MVHAFPRGVAAAAFACAAVAAAAQSTADAPAHRETVRVEAETQPDFGTPTPKSARARPESVVAIVLDPLVPDAAAKTLRPTVLGVPQQIGIARPVPALEDPSVAHANLQWEPLPEGGWIAAVSITSPEAMAMRLGIEAASLPDGTVLRFHGPNDPRVHEVGVEEVRRSVARNLAAGVEPGEARTFWSPVVEDASLVMEVVLPRGATPQSARIAAPIASHLVASARNGFAVPKAAAACEIDVMCHIDGWQAQSNAVARIVYTVGGGTYVCSGTMLADQDPSTFIPYFHTANHCIDTQAAASSIQSYWFYRSTACDSGLRGPYRTLTGGATLLYASPETDTAFVRLNGTPPAGAGYSGWFVGATPSPGTDVTALHHPTGDLQKISFGDIHAYWTCAATSEGKFICDGAPAASSTFYGVRWRRGITEKGSSGSGIFLDNGRYLIGQLYGGSTSCTESGNEFYGRFDVAWNAGIRQWLGAPSSGPTAPAIAPTRNYSDLWWNPSESGWGLAITQHPGDAVFAAWYIYDGAGRPLWVAMPGGRWTSPTVFTGDLYATTGPDGLGAFDPSRVVNSRIGVATLDFAAADRATLTYTAYGITESRAVQRQLFGAPGSTAPGQFGDMWWNPSESGWGLSISQQHGALFVVWYTYRADGTPAWYVMPDGRWSGGTWAGTLYRTTYAPTPFMGRRFDPGAVTPVPVGTMSIAFSGTNAATMRYTVDGVSGTKAISRQVF
jgi:hypothetical protein